MENLILFVVTFILCFLGRLTRYLLSKRKKSKKKKNSNGIAVEMKYLMMKFGLKEKKIDKKSVALIISLLDGLIIATTLIIVVVITENIILQMIIGLIVVIGLIYITYEVFGRILKKRGYDKDGL